MYYLDSFLSLDLSSMNSELPFILPMYVVVPYFLLILSAKITPKMTPTIISNVHSQPQLVLLKYITIPTMLRGINGARKI